MGRSGTEPQGAGGCGTEPVRAGGSGTAECVATFYFRRDCAFSVELCRLLRTVPALASRVQCVDASVHRVNGLAATPTLYDGQRHEQTAAFAWLLRRVEGLVSPEALVELVVHVDRMIDLARRRDQDALRDYMASGDARALGPFLQSGDARALRAYLRGSAVVPDAGGDVLCGSAGGRLARLVAAPSEPHGASGHSVSGYSVSQQQQQQGSSQLRGSSPHGGSGGLRPIAPAAGRAAPGARTAFLSARERGAYGPGARDEDARAALDERLRCIGRAAAEWSQHGASGVPSRPPPGSIRDAISRSAAGRGSAPLPVDVSRADQLRQQQLDEVRSAFPDAERDAAARRVRQPSLPLGTRLGS